MKYEWKKYIAEMQKHGYAVVVISPEDMKGIPAVALELAMNKEAQECITAWHEAGE
jgi:hypothetical protein